MNRLIGSLLLLSLCFVACQKEVSFETGSGPSAGSLQSDVSGDCLPKTVSGIYEVNKALKPDSNYIQVEVDVLQTGSYVISTNTVNGMSFTASGFFTTTGSNTVKLKGDGTPLTDGISNFVVTYDSTVCDIAVTVLPAGGAVPAVFTLDGAPGSCMNAQVFGAYIVDTALTISNTVVIHVTVTTPGTYNITTQPQTSNGIWFDGSGTLAAGPQTITLTGHGTPEDASNPANIPVKVVTPAGQTECSFQVIVTGPAAYTINCGTATANGIYEERKALAGTNTITLPVTVTTPGSYNLTATINGMTFTASGTLAATPANQTITLIGSGSPTNPGTSNLQITVGTTTCNIPITVLPVDYFPRVANNNWSYQFDGVANDSILIRAKSGTVTISGNVYNEFEGTADASSGFGPAGRYRKSAGNYYAYRDMGAYFGFTNTINMDYMFLKDDINVGDSIQTATINGIDSSNNTIPIRIVFKIEQKNTSITIGATTYNNVIVVSEKYQVMVAANTWIYVTDILGYYKTYYAKNIGMIKEEGYYEDGNPNPPRVYQQDLRRYQVF